MDLDQILDVVSVLCGFGAGLSGVLAFIIWATSKWGDGNQEGMTDAKMMKCIQAAAGFTAAAIIVQFLTLDISFS